MFLCYCLIFHAYFVNENLGKFQRKNKIFITNILSSSSLQHIKKTLKQVFLHSQNKMLAVCSCWLIFFFPSLLHWDLKEVSVLAIQYEWKGRQITHTCAKFLTVRILLNLCSIGAWLFNVFIQAANKYLSESDFFMTNNGFSLTNKTQMSYRVWNYYTR